MKKNLLIATILTYVLSTGISYVAFSQMGGKNDTETVTPVDESKKANNYDALEFDPNQKKTEECPLNGAYYSKQQRQWWEQHRPLGVMIENHEDARPQSGIYFADVVYEAVAEGGILRTMSVFYCQDAGIVGPVRSARTYFLDWISEYGADPLYVHVGGANTPGPANALGQIEDYGWAQYNDINQFSVGFPTFRRDESRLGRPVATEHTMYSTTSKLWKVAKDRKLTNVDEDGNAWDEDFVKYSFKDDAATSARGKSQAIHLELWDGMPDYVIDWKYDPQTNTYLRSNGGEPHMDRNTNKQLYAKNLVVLQMQESRANDGYEGNLHLLYKNKGTGKAIFFIDGKRVNGTWKKDKRTSRTMLLAADGSEMKLNRGLIWFEILPLDGIVDVK